MYEGGIRVPAIVKYPIKVKANVKSDQVICGYDFYPTLLSLAGIPEMPNDHQDGIDIFNRKKHRLFNKRKMYWYYPLKHVSGHTPSAAIRQGDYKLILDLNTRDVKLFNIRKDISEDHDLSNKKIKLAETLSADLLSFIDEYEK